VLRTTHVCQYRPPGGILKWTIRHFPHREPRQKRVVQRTTPCNSARCR
jgi:hypothetical protein